MKKTTALIICLILTALIVPLAAVTVSAENASDYGISVTKDKTYNKDGKFWYSVNLSADTYMVTYTVKLLNSKGGQVAKWPSEYTVIPDWDKPVSKKTVARAYGYDFSGLPTDKYTLRVTGTAAVGVTWDWELDVGVVIKKSYYFDFAIDHKQPELPAKISLQSEKSATFDDGTTGHVFTFKQENGKGKKITYEIYDSYGWKIFSKTSGVLSYTSGTNRMTWNYYPTDGGLKVGAGKYTIKYWITGGNPKEYVFYIN